MFFSLIYNIVKVYLDLVLMGWKIAKGGAIMCHSILLSL